jgi:DNA-directed RNA polymerase specialized sigma24 family protein
MQPPTNTRPSQVVRGDEEALYRRHHRDLERTVAHAVRAPRELIEEACQTAWTTLLRSQPERPTIFAWLRVVAIHEAFRLSATERRDARLEHLTGDSGGWDAVIPDGRSLDAALEAREALRALAALPARQRDDLALLIAGYSYREIAEITGGRTRTNVNKALGKARERLRRGARTRTSPRAGGPTTAPSRPRRVP